MNTTNFLLSSLDENRIQVQSQISSSKRLLESMAALLSAGIGPEAKEKDVYHLLLEREKLGNTGVGSGVAIPHSRCDFTQRAIVAIITLDQGVDYDSLDGQPVDVAFGLLVPEKATQDHLKLLADIAQLMSNVTNKNTLAAADTPANVIKLIRRWVGE